MTHSTDITDLDLLAYADGRLEPARARRVESALAEDPALRAKIDDFARQNAELAAQFDAYAEAPLPDRFANMLRTEPAAGRAPRRWVGQAAAAATVALAAGASGWWLGSTAAPDRSADRILASAAELHAAEAPTAPQEAAGQPTKAIPWISDQVSLEVGVPDLRDKGFTLIDKRRVNLGGGKGVRLRYRTENGTSFDVFLKTRWRERGGRVSTTQRDGTALAHWLDGPLRVVVAAPSAGGPEIEAIARTLRERMRRDHREDAPELEPYGGDTPAQTTATRSPEVEPTSRSGDNRLDAPAAPDLLQPVTEGQQ